MDIIEKPYGWVEISDLDSFESFLRRCPDYRCKGYTGSLSYRYAHNNEPFAVIVRGVLFVKPELLE